MYLRYNTVRYITVEKFVILLRSKRDIESYEEIMTTLFYQRWWVGIVDQGYYTLTNIIKHDPFDLCNC